MWRGMDDEAPGRRSVAERFLCDEMLVGLARLLRAAGYDTALAAPGTPDTALLALAGAEQRLLLTCDRAFAMRADERAVLLGSGSADDQAAELGRSLAIDWCLAPFTRCLVDNALLRAARAEEVARAPQAGRRSPGPFHACPTCLRLYWPGSHVRRLEARLRRLHADRRAVTHDEGTVMRQLQPPLADES